MSKTPSQQDIKKRISDALRTAAPSSAGAVIKKTIKELLDDIEIRNVALAAVDSTIEKGVLTTLFDSLIGGTVQNRAEMYTDATYATFENSVLEREKDEGVTLGRRVLEGGGNSCEDCISASSDEFVPLGELPEIGDSECQSRCRCEFEFSTDAGEFSTSDLFSATIGGQDKYGGSVELN
ncbi:MAG: hypothetical protein H0V18_07805 [Pyrinomonadaceae bacterium]|nr:hypothetical protein [Pyrinomonadaceae bacterium]